MPADRDRGLDGRDQRRAPIGGPVGLYDTTLRDGEQTVGVVLDPEQKLELARAIDSLGIERIEAGFPRVSEDDWRAVELIVDAGLKAEVWGFSRAVPADIEALVELGVQASVIESPISRCEARRPRRLAREDARADPGRRLLRRRARHHRRLLRRRRHPRRPRVLPPGVRDRGRGGAKEAVVVDTIGVATPEAVEELVGETREWLGPNVPLHFHGHNDFGLATSAAVAAVRAGANWIQGTINGMGERGGNANLIEVA